MYEHCLLGKSNMLCLGDHTLKKCWGSQLGGWFSISWSSSSHGGGPQWWTTMNKTTNKLSFIHSISQYFGVLYLFQYFFQSLGRNIIYESWDWESPAVRGENGQRPICSLLPFGHPSENSRQLCCATQLLVKHHPSCFAKYPWLNNNWHTLRSVTLNLWQVNERMPREMENVFLKKALHHEYGSRLLPYFLYSRSRCSNADSSFGKTKLIVTSRTGYRNAFMLLLHMYLIGKLQFSQYSWWVREKVFLYQLSMTDMLSICYMKFRWRN